MKLRPLKKEDALAMLEWMHDPDIQKAFRYDMLNQNLNDVLSFIKNASLELRDGNSLHFAVADDSDEYLGTISLKNLDLTSKNAELAISLRKMVHGKGVATWAVWELLKLAFLDFGLQRVYLNVLSDNIQAIRFYEKFGFIFEGEFRNHLYLRGKFKNLLWYRMLRDEFYAKQGGNDNAYYA